MTLAPRKEAGESRSCRAAGLSLAALAVLAACGGPAAPPPPPPVPVFSAQSGFDRISDEVVVWFHAAHPVRATRLGVRDADGRMPSVFPGDLEERRHELRAYQTRLAGVRREVLQGDDRIDYRVLEHGMRAALLDLEELAVWRREPQRYVAQISAGTTTLVEAGFATLDARMRSMNARWREVPLLLRAARQNLEAARVPRLFADVAVEDARATIEYLSSAVPAALGAQGLSGVDAALRSEWEAGRRAAIASTDSFALWLETDLAPRAIGDFRLGAGTLAQVLLYREHVDLDLQTIDALNRQAITEYREWMDRLGMAMDPMRYPEAIVDSITVSLAGGRELIPARLRGMTMSAPPTAPRAFFLPRSLALTWPHYLDHDALERETDPAALLAGIRRALHGHALLHAMIALHAGGATIEQVAQDIGSIALLDPAAALQEARRVAQDPSAGLPALGRMQAIVLRERMRAERPASFDQAAFGDELMRMGLPVMLAAEAMLEREPGPLLVAGRRTPGVPEPPRALD